MSPAIPQVQAFFEPTTGTVSYVLFEQAGGACAVVDAVLDFEPRAARVSTASADRIAACVQERGLQVAWLLETHVHADHLSASHHLQQRLGGRIAIGESVRQVRETLAPVFRTCPAAAPDRVFDHLFRPDECFAVGRLRVRAMPVPGHTPADTAYVVEDAAGVPALAFVGDTLFMPDVGSARCDFPGGDARQLYRSARALLALPDAVRLFMCHDYPPGDRAAQWESSVLQQRRHNIHLRDGIGEEAFVAMRQARDRQLALPALILPALQVNLQGGRLPQAEDNGLRYLRIPMGAL